MNKYGNKKTVVDNITFDSQKEAARYKELRLLEKAGEISGLVLQPTFVLNVNGVKVCSYRADFRYAKVNRDKTGLRISGMTNVVEDVKGMKTPVYRLKKKLVKAIHGIEIQEI